MKNVIYFFIGTYINCLGYLSKKKAASFALRLFTTPMKGFITKKQAEFLDSAFQEEFEYNSFIINTYRWPGKGKTILLAHGWESNSGRWENLINTLRKKDYNIIALDAPAHGNSGNKRFTAILYSEFINVVIQRFHPDTIIAHSAGGMATIFAFEKYKYSNIEKLTLLGTPSEFKNIFDNYIKMLHINMRVTKQLELLILEQFGKLPAEFSTAKSSRYLQVESLIIHDKNDTIIPYSDAIKIKESLKNSSLITTKNLGHSLNNEEVYSRIGEFLSPKSVSLQHERAQTTQ